MFWNFHHLKKRINDTVTSNIWKKTFSFWIDKLSMIEMKSHFGALIWDGSYWFEKLLISIVHKMAQPNEIYQNCVESSIEGRILTSSYELNLLNTFWVLNEIQFAPLYSIRLSVSRILRHFE